MVVKNGAIEFPNSSVHLRVAQSFDSPLSTRLSLKLPFTTQQSTFVLTIVIPHLAPIAARRPDQLHLNKRRITSETHCLRNWFGQWCLAADPFPYFHAMDWNIGVGLETQSHSPVLDLDHRDFDHALKAY